MTRALRMVVTLFCLGAGLAACGADGDPVTPTTRLLVDW